MKAKKDIHKEVIIDALNLKFSKDLKLNQKVFSLISRGSQKHINNIDPVEVFAFTAAGTLLLIKRNSTREIKRLLYLDSHTKQHFRIENLNNYKV